MYIEQIYTNCLAQGAYYIHSNGEAAIIDPLRETAPYMDKLRADNVSLKYIFETHFHADFVSGHLSLAKKTGATIVYGPEANTKYDATNAIDGQEFKVGDLTITALHTPGHTIESTCYLLKDADGKEMAIFTGDTLFLGDVGRPDLCQKGSAITEADLAGMLYDSLRTKIMPLPDEVKVYPAHGAGSACGKNMMKITVDTLGNQKQVNYALRADMTKEEFIAEVTAGLTEAPAYFPENVRMNKDGYDHIDDIVNKGLKALAPNEFKLVRALNNALVLDVRSKEDFRDGHVPGSLFIGLDGSFAPWVGALIKDVKKPILIVAPPGREEETIIRLARVGFDKSLGYLKGGVAAWASSRLKTTKVKQISAKDLQQKNLQEEPVYDCRKPSEYNAAHIKEVTNLPLATLDKNLKEVPQKKPFYIHCQSGYRSMIASSLLLANGIEYGIDVEGGYKALVNLDIEVEESFCSKTTL